MRILLRDAKAPASIVEADPFEEKNLWKQRPEIVDTLRKVFQDQWGNGRSRPI